MRLAVTPIVLALALCACASPFRGAPTTEELAAADYGPPPSDYGERLKALILVRYQDRSVAAVELGQPRRNWYGELGRLTRSRDVRFGWAVPFRGYRLGFASLESVIVQGMAFFRNAQLEAIEDENGLEFVNP